MRKPEEFRSLASIVSASEEPTMTCVAAIDPPAAMFVQEPQHGCPEYDEAIRDIVREVRLFHARIAESVEAAVETIALDIASEIVGRELQIAPVAIESIVRRALERYAASEPLRVRVHPDEARHVVLDVPVAGDSGLRRGDVFLELRCGTVDASLGVRLADVLREACA